jgi:hypothetical protein
MDRNPREPGLVGVVPSLKLGVVDPSVRISGNGLFGRGRT